MPAQITDDLDALLRVLPEKTRERLVINGRRDHLLEVILDLGRVPTARYTDGEVVLAETEVARDDIKSVVDRIGDLDADNRAGIARTLHRISAIRNRKRDVVGLTCRVGRAVYGTIEIIEDIIQTGANILLLGPPGVGKTTMLREAARVLAEQKRVIIVDTSNEIGGDGDIPHPAIGRARRMQVAEPILQHEVMIEAVENHNPEVIVIDEIGRELEAAAARTIAERGVQLIGTAHGRTLDNLLLNPTLSDLVGGVESVTLSDEEARRRGTQKTVLERRSPPTFAVLVEIQDRQRLAVHADIARAVDSLLRGQPLAHELRYRDGQGEIQIEEAAAATRNTTRNDRKPDVARPGKLVRVYPFGVARNRLAQAAKRLKVSIQIVDDLKTADAMVTLKSYFRRRPRLILDAERRQMPVFVLRANTMVQMENFLIDWFRMDAEADPVERALQDVDQAVKKVLAGRARIDLAPQTAQLRRKQHEVARQHNLTSHSFGKDPRRRVRIYRD